MLSRVLSLVKKELQALLQDPRSRYILIGPACVQLIVLTFAATLEVKNNTIAVYNQDYGSHSQELIARLLKIGAFSEIVYAHSFEESKKLIDEQKALIALHIPEDFSRSLERSKPVRIQAIGDGRRSNSGQIALGYLNEIVQGYGREIVLSRLKGTTNARPSNPPGLVVRHWFNPNLRYIWYNVPALVMLLTTLMAMMVTGFSIAREREMGTFDQLLVSPLSPTEILLGKTVPAFIVALTEAAFIVLVGVLVYQVPFRGSLLLLFMGLSVYILSLVGIGLLLSSLCQTQQQAILSVFAFTLPAILLSGYASPIDNMPEFLQVIVQANPLKHAFILVKGIFLKDFTFAMVWENTWPLLIIAAVSLTSANLLFRSKVG